MTSIDGATSRKSSVERRSVAGRISGNWHTVDTRMPCGRSQATLDRRLAFASTAERSRYENRLLVLFQQEVLAYVEPGREVPSGNALALLARHHGLPSSWTDWTTSPYIAAYFAFSSAKSIGSRVAIRTLLRDRLPPTFADDDLVADALSLRFNTRAIRQRGLFIRVADANTSLDTLLSEALVKITLPATAVTTAMADLLLMTVNASTLFDDLSGAARAAFDRMRYGF